MFRISIQMILFKWRVFTVLLTRPSKKVAFGVIIRRIPRRENLKHGTKTVNLRESHIIPMDYAMGFMNIGIPMVKESQYRIIQMDKNTENALGGTMMVLYKMNWCLRRV
jgi:hypothetical protein